MTRQLSSSVVVAVLAALLGYSWAQRPSLGGADGSRQASCPVAVVNVEKLFREFQELNRRMAVQRERTTALQNDIKHRKKELEELAEALSRIPDGTGEFERLKRQLEERKTGFETWAKESATDIQRETAENLAWGYNQIQERIKEYTEQRGIKLVSQVNRTRADHKDLKAIMGVMQQPVVAYHAAIDITDDILQMLN